jgi:hypothetical protein
MSLATSADIRDRILTVLESQTPTVLSGNKFLRHRAERDGRFEDWIEKNPAAALRRIDCSEVGTDDTPDVSSMTEEAVLSDFEIRVAYPQSHRYGPDNARDRMDAVNKDWKLINYCVGLYGRASFSGANDCTVVSATKSNDTIGAVDVLVVRLRIRYQRLIA